MPAKAGGTVVEGTSCESHPCAPVPPPVVAVCRVPDDDGAECEVLTPDHCAARNGTPSAATSCGASPCGDHSGGDQGDDGGGSSGGHDGGHGD